MRTPEEDVAERIRGLASLEHRGDTSGSKRGRYVLRRRWFALAR